MSQNDQILRRLRRGPLTSIGAVRELNCLRLGARIYELREKGHDISSVMVAAGGKRVARYTLVKEARR